MKRPRLSVRGMMALVAIVGVGIGLWGTLVRARHFQREADKHAVAEQEWELSAIEYEELADKDAKWYASWKSSGEKTDMLFDHLNELPFQAEGGGYAEHRSMLEYLRDVSRKAAAKERQLRIKYERAARRPWLPVEPDEEKSGGKIGASSSSSLKSEIVPLTQIRPRTVHLCQMPIHFRKELGEIELAGAEKRRRCPLVGGRLFGFS